MQKKLPINSSSLKGRFRTEENLQMEFIFLIDHGPHPSSSRVVTAQSENAFNTDMALPQVSKG